jgi:Fe-S-cluster containining protein
MPSVCGPASPISKVAIPNVRSAFAGAPKLRWNDCAALDPASGTCDLYAARPITCRRFGPAVRFGAESVAVCELCYRGASDAQIAACEVAVDPENLEAELLQHLERTGQTGDTVVAFALAQAS